MIVIPKSEKIEQLNITPSELKIISLLAQGYTKQQVGNILNNSHHTIEKHMGNVRNKMEVNSMMMVVRYALDHNLITVEN